MNQHSLTSSDSLTPVLTAPAPRTPCLSSVACFTVAHAAQRIVAKHGHNLEVPREFTSASAAAFWQTAAQAVGEELAVIIAQDLPLGSFGRAGYHTISAATLGEALDVLGKQYIAQMATGLTLHVLPVSRDSVDIVIRCVGESWLSAHIEELAIAALHQQLLTLAARVSAEQVMLRRPSPTTVLTSRWRSLFGTLPTFGHHQSSIRIPTAALLAPLRTADPDVARRMSDDHQNGGSQLRERVRNIVRARLQTPPNSTELAAALTMTSRTLQRRLQHDQTSIRDLIAQTRIEVACEMLCNTNVAIQDVAEVVGFAQPASFTRAFVAATGQTPLGYRKRWPSSSNAPATRRASNSAQRDATEQAIAG